MLGVGGGGVVANQMQQSWRGAGAETEKIRKVLEAKLCLLETQTDSLTNKPFTLELRFLIQVYKTSVFKVLVSTLGETSISWSRYGILTPSQFKKFSPKILQVW